MTLFFFAFLADHFNEPSGTGALASKFDKSVLQISDWLNWEQNMIKIQAVTVGDVEAVRMAIEKQEVSNKNFQLKASKLKTNFCFYFSSLCTTIESFAWTENEETAIKWIG